MGIQPDPPGRVGKFLQQLEAKVDLLLQKLGGPPIDPADFPPGPREEKEHPGDCSKAHRLQTHEEWKNTP